MVKAINTLDLGDVGDLPRVSVPIEMNGSGAAIIGIPEQN